jgi:hypothetical protein
MVLLVVVLIVGCGNIDFRLDKLLMIDYSFGKEKQEESYFLNSESNQPRS